MCRCHVNFSRCYMQMPKKSFAKTPQTEFKRYSLGYQNSALIWKDNVRFPPTIISFIPTIPCTINWLKRLRCQRGEGRYCAFEYHGTQAGFCQQKSHKVHAFLRYVFPPKSGRDLQNQCKENTMFSEERMSCVPLTLTVIYTYGNIC